MTEIQREFLSVVVNDEYFRGKRTAYSASLRSRRRHTDRLKNRDIAKPEIKQKQFNLRHAPSEQLLNLVPELLNSQVENRKKLFGIFQALVQVNQVDDFTCELLYFMQILIDSSDEKQIMTINGFDNFQKLPAFLGVDYRADRSIAISLSKVSKFSNNILRIFNKDYVIGAVKFLLAHNSEDIQRIAIYTVKNLIDEQDFNEQVFELALFVVNSANQIFSMASLDTQKAAMKVFARFLYTQQISQSITMDHVYTIAQCTENYLNKCENSQLETGMAVLKELARSSQYIGTITDNLIAFAGRGLLADTNCAVTTQHAMQHIVQLGSPEQLDCILKQDVLTVVDSGIRNDNSDVRLNSYILLGNLIQRHKTIPEHEIMQNILHGLNDPSMPVKKQAVWTVLCCFTISISFTKQISYNSDFLLLLHPLLNQSDQVL